MFTIEQIKTAHSKVRSGAEFPAYIAEIKTLGVTHYETFVIDGHTAYYGAHDYVTKAPAKYASLEIAEFPDMELFKRELKTHQQGQTDFLTFINMCAATGIQKWSVSMEQMTCTYYDQSNAVILVEKIPG